MTKRPNKNPENGSDLLDKHNVTVTGNASAGPTLIFAHGFGTDQTAWHRVAEAFLPDWRVILYDNAGSGSTAPEDFSPHKYDSLHAYASDLIELCTILDVKDAVIVAHSVSGMISLLAAIKAPQHFSRLVMIGASARYLNDGDYIGGFEQDTLDVFYKAMDTQYQAWVSGFAPLAMSNADRPELAASFAKSLGAIRPDIAQSVSRVIFQSDFRAELSNLDKPTLLIQSREDIAVPQSVADFLHSHIHDSQLKVINATGHLPHMSAPEQVIATIQKYLKKPA